MFVEFEVMWINTFLCTFHNPVLLVALQVDELKPSDEQTQLQWPSLVSFLIRMKDYNFNISLSSLMFFEYIDSYIDHMKNFCLIFLMV